jgi:hypothetical protein
MSEPGTFRCRSCLHIKKISAIGSDDGHGLRCKACMERLKKNTKKNGPFESTRKANKNLSSHIDKFMEAANEYRNTEIPGSD